MTSIKVPRACESCRSLKVRCLPALEGTKAEQTDKCQRCAASGNDCFYTLPRRTRRQRTDVRVRELEKEVKALSQLLKGEQGLKSSNPQHPRQHSPARPMAFSELPKSILQSQSPDPISSGLISVQHAVQLFDLYVSEMAPQRPIVYFPPGTDALDVRATKPVLFLAIMTIAASTQDESLTLMLMESLVQTYAERIMIKGEKSLELIHAILVTTNWKSAPDTYDQAKFYQQLHIAATMVIDMDLGNLKGHPESRPIEPNEDISVSTIARARTFLGCYMCCSSISLGFRKSTMFPLTEFVDDCINLLEKSPYALPQDSGLLAWVRIQRIIDLSAAALRLRDCHRHVELSDPGVQLMLQNCSNQLESWRVSVPADIMSVALNTQYEFLVCLLHEPCLYSDYDWSEFRPPYSLNEPSSQKAKNAPMLTPMHLSSIHRCISSSNSIIQAVLSMSTSSLRYSPITVFARLTYAVLMIVRIYLSSTTSQGSLNGVLNADEVEAPQVLNQVVRKLGQVCSTYCGSAKVWFSLTIRIQTWFHHHLRSVQEPTGLPVNALTDLLTLVDVHGEPAISLPTKTNHPDDMNEESVCLSSAVNNDVFTQQITSAQDFDFLAEYTVQDTYQNQVGAGEDLGFGDSSIDLTSWMPSTAG